MILLYKKWGEGNCSEVLEGRGWWTENQFPRSRFEKTLASVAPIEKNLIFTLLTNNKGGEDFAQYFISRRFTPLSSYTRKELVRTAVASYFTQDRNTSISVLNCPKSGIIFQAQRIWNDPAGIAEFVCIALAP